MELIIIKGKRNVGKTTIATLLHNKISEIKGIELMWMMYDLLKLPVEEKDLYKPRVPDFRSVFHYKEKRIGIVSHGDTSRYAKQFIRQMINDFSVDILIVCSSIDSYNWNMLNRDFGEYIKTENIFEVTKDDEIVNKCDKLFVKDRLVNNIINHINQIYDRI